MIHQRQQHHQQQQLQQQLIPPKQGGGAEQPERPESMNNNCATPPLSPPTAARTARQNRLRQMSSLRQRAVVQKQLEQHLGDDLEVDLRYSSCTLEGMLL
eukprot:CAMPEP_0178591450 /NCGR_PEP_ID=MMETSP0697-20121206/28794_1 /TAXON_ID=265572 /ORGANISM="Extubocellulus spinifer, Strain CCMP396" /LENGTH=99 /DNA_ID=CAMNT_0020228309 /DNA_START=486 /DNA_END=781 /DNA_ORIENTATION=+